MPEFINLAGTATSNIEIPQGNVLPYPLTFKDEAGAPILLTGNDFVFECYRNSPTALLFSVEGVLSVDNYEVSFPLVIELGVGTYRFRVNRINDGQTMTRVRGRLKISR